MATKKTTKKATKKPAKKTVKATAKKPVKKVTKKTTKTAAKKPAKKTVKKKTVAKEKKGDVFECGICGYRLVVDEVCGCVEEHMFVCCEKKMKKKRVKKAKTK